MSIFGLLKKCCSFSTFCLENHDCQLTFPINVIRPDVISSQCVPVAAPPLCARSGAALWGSGEVQYCTVEQSRMQFEQLNACAAECSSVSLWIINTNLSHILFMCYFLYPSGAFCYHRPRGPTRVNLAQSAWAEHILFSNYLPTALCSPHHDQFTNSVFRQYISNANSLLSTVLLILATVDGCVYSCLLHQCKARDCSSTGGFDLNMINNVSKKCFKGQNYILRSSCSNIHTGTYTVRIKLPLWTCWWLLTPRWWAEN